MTQEQLNLLLRYMNLKARIAAKEARGQGVSPHSYDELAVIIGELEDLCED